MFTITKLQLGVQSGRKFPHRICDDVTVNQKYKEGKKTKITDGNIIITEEYIFHLNEHYNNYYSEKVSFTIYHYRPVFDVVMHSNKITGP